ncbi:MAG: hypothetical protein ACP5QA_04795 [Phycisphaerae bacterium]
MGGDPRGALIFIKVIRLARSGKEGSEYFTVSHVEELGATVGRQVQGFTEIQPDRMAHAQRFECQAVEVRG